MTRESKHSRFLALFADTQMRLYSYILMVVSSRSQADDIFQDTSALLWEQFENYQESTSFGAWAIAIAKNKVLEHFRERKHWLMSYDNDLNSHILASAETRSEEDDTRLKAFRSCLFKLDRDSRVLLSLRYEKNVPAKIIAEQQGITTGALYRKLSKLFAALRQCVNRTVVQWE